MKKITKGIQAPELTKWLEDNAGLPQNLAYGAAKFPIAEVLKGLLVEQGYVCAYTLLRIGEASAHIEHLKPQTLCRSDDTSRAAAKLPLRKEDIAWSNMVACAPEPNIKVKPPYGATKKDDWWDAEFFLSPLDVTCEERFAYTNDGKIASSSAADVAAKETIERIGLGKEKLCELRKEAFLQAGIHKRSDKPITSVVKVEQLIAKWSKKNQATSECVEFCVPLVQVAKEYAKFLRTRGHRE
ncbi:HNH endonuclease family protein [Polaromonas glacialis]|uniref:hypothetical protein n=1 Tax=Polaromonas glacialis TaxID=866564 RepID=UPI0018DDBA70|nr:hypothetical protein [Polaromonas glacialis]